METAELGMVAYTIGPSTLEAEAGRSLKFKTNLIYIMSSGLASVMW